jgi:bacteriocin-like protein
MISPSTDGIPPPTRENQESVMQKIVELSQNELQAVTGGHKTVSAATTTTSSQLSVSASTYSVSSDVKTASVSSSVTVSGYRL